MIANESEPFCSSCTRLRLSSDGYLYGCLSSSRRQSISDLLDMPSHLALPKLQNILVSALTDKKLAFEGEATVMKFIGGLKRLVMLSLMFLCGESLLGQAA